MLVNNFFDLSSCHPKWHGILNNAFKQMDDQYLAQLKNDSNWLPGISRLLAAFSLSLDNLRYVLLGESPYPRSVSANGYAFWDNSVGCLWNSSGLSKQVNRATSLRNWIKMLLVARGALKSDLSQQAIAEVNKCHLVQTAEQLFLGMMEKGILLLNASLVYSEGKVPYHARHWKPFLTSVLNQIALIKPDVQLIVFGKLAESIPQNQLTVGLISEHPYNVSFITNKRVIDFFKPLDLLSND